MLKLTVSGPECLMSCHCDRMAADWNKHSPVVLMASIVATGGAAKTISAVFQSATPSRQLKTEEGNLSFYNEGYTVTKAKLGRYDAFHMVIRAKRDDVIYGDIREGVKQRLFSQHIDSPILPEWSDYVIDKLIEMDMVRPLNCHEIKAYVIRFESTDTDAIVAEGLRDKVLQIPRRKHAS